jgi:hypothetical protein
VLWRPLTYSLSQIDALKEQIRDLQQQLKTQQSTITGAEGLRDDNEAHGRPSHVFIDQTLESVTVNGAELAILFERYGHLCRLLACEGRTMLMRAIVSLRTIILYAPY